MNKTFRNSLTLIALALFLLSPVTSIAQTTTSSIRGGLVDQNGAPVSGTAVVITDTRNGARREFTSNASGTFLATNLPVGGPYVVTVTGAEPVTIDSISLGDVFALTISLTTTSTMEEVVVTGQSTEVVETTTGPTATFSSFELDTSVAISRDITEVYALDPRLNVDNEDDGYAVNCAGKHPRFNSVTLDGVSQSDRFGLNENGYSTAVGMPFPYAAIQQVSVELAPFDVTFGGFSACNINAVTKTGSNVWSGGLFYEHASDDLRGDTVKTDSGTQVISSPSYSSFSQGFNIGGPIIKDKLFVFAAYEESETPRFLAIGPAGSGNGTERPWMSQADFDRVKSIAQTKYDYDPGGSPSDGVQTAEKYMVRLDWNINDRHNAALIYNYFDGVQNRNSDGDSSEFEFSNHFYDKGAESETLTFKLASQWTDAFSTEFFLSSNEMNDSQFTVGPKDFGDFQIDVDGGANTIYLGADDSRQANKLSTKSDFFKFTGQYLAGNHIITAGFESEELEIFNIFVQHSAGGEWDFQDDSVANPAHCAALSAQGRFDDPACGTSGIDKFELGMPSRVFYGSGGGTNNPLDAAANFSNTLNSVYIQDEVYFDNKDLTLVYGLRYDWFDSSDRPVFNQNWSNANGGLRNDANLDGVDILMPRFGFTWGATDDLTVRGGVGLYSGGNPNVWLSNAWSNDGFTNVQTNRRYSNLSVFDGGIPLSGAGRPGYDVPQSLVDFVGSRTLTNASTRSVVLIDPDYEQPSEWKIALGATWETPYDGLVVDFDYLHSRSNDAAQYIDLSQTITGYTILGQPRYRFTNGADNLMLTNSPYHAETDIFSVVLSKEFENGLDLSLGYAYTNAEDIVPMTSATAGSNFDNVALLDVNDPKPATTNYEVPHRITMRASYGHEFFSDLTTRITLLGYNAEGQPQSYVMQGLDLEGDGFFGRHLLYVPNGSSDPNVVYGSGFDRNAFDQWVADNGLEPGFVARNAQHAKWSTRFDLRVDQEIPFFGEARGRLYVKVYNLGNMLNSKWGHVNDAQFFSQQVVNANIDSQGRYVYTRFRDVSVEDLLETRSLYEIKIGLEFNF